MLPPPCETHPLYPAALLQRIEDPIGLLPARLILGINKRGVHFFRPVPKEYLHSAELRDIMQVGCARRGRLQKALQHAQTHSHSYVNALGVADSPWGRSRDPAAWFHWLSAICVRADVHPI